MKEKKVTLSVYTAERLEEYRELNDKYERLAKDVDGIDLTHLENDDALVCRAISYAIDEVKESISGLESIKEERMHNDD